jgi:hypothetical protein
MGFVRAEDDEEVEDIDAKEDIVEEDSNNGEHVHKEEEEGKDVEREDK